MATLHTYPDILLQSFNSISSYVLTCLLAALFISTPGNRIPYLKVPQCPDQASITYDHSVPNLTAFPKTEVNACYTNKHLKLHFIAREEKAFFYNSSLGTNNPIWRYEVMEAFIARGTDDPSTYLEFEVAPNNVTFTAIIVNPSGSREEGAPFERHFIDDPIGTGFSSETILDRKRQTWTSSATIPLTLFGLATDRHARGEKWRINFFRTVTSAEDFPVQQYGAWSPPDEANFHKTSFFGHVEFV